MCRSHIRDMVGKVFILRTGEQGGRINESEEEYQKMESVNRTYSQRQLDQCAFEND